MRRRLLAVAGRAADGCYPNASVSRTCSSRRTRSVSAPTRCCCAVLKTPAIPRPASASGIWAICRPSCPPASGSTITTACPYSNDMQVTKRRRPAAAAHAQRDHHRAARQPGPAHASGTPGGDRVLSGNTRPPFFLFAHTMVHVRCTF